MAPRRGHPRLAQGAVAAGLVLVLPWIACVREPDMTKMKCTTAKGCPPSYVCTDTGSGWYCKSPRDGGPAADVPGFTSFDAAKADAVDANQADDAASVDTQGEGMGGGGSGSGGDVDLNSAPGAGGTGGASVSVDASDSSRDLEFDVPQLPVTDGGTGGSLGTGGVSGQGGTSSSGGAFDGGGSSGQGGALVTGGTTGSGGASSGGSTTTLAQTGGALSLGGTTGTGGVVGTGGTQGAGGVPATGGSSSPGAGGACSLAGAANALTIAVDSSQYTVSDGIFGVLMERLGRNWQGGIWVGSSPTIPNTDGMRNDIIDGFKEAGVGMIEWPGGCAATSYNWSANENPSTDVGTDRYMKLCQLLGIEPMITGPGTAAAVVSNLAWVTYINANPNGHTDWALHYFKIGNEVWGCGGNQDEPTYETNYLANYDKLSAPINGQKLNIVASTGVIGDWTWFDTEVKNLVGKIDGVEIHDYIYHSSDIPCVGFTDNDYYNVVNAANAGQIGPRIDKIVSYLDTYDPTKHIKIYEDQWGDWLEPFNKTTDGWTQQGTVMDAISAAESLHLFMQHADRYAMAGLAQGINVIHSLMLTDSGNSALVKTPTFYVFKMFLPHHRSGAKWAPSTLTSESITGNSKTFPVLSAGTTIDSLGRVNVSLVNVDLANTRTIQITLNSSIASYSVSTAQIVTGAAKDTYNDFGQAEQVNIQSLAPANYTICGRALNVTLPPKSVVMLVLAPQP